MLDNLNINLGFNTHENVQSIWSKPCNGNWLYSLAWMML